VSRPPKPRPAVRLPAALREFLDTEVGGGVVLLVATAAALVWANSPWRESYDALWHTELTLRLGAWELSEELRHWVNDALMALFFFVVGLEIKHELTVGELRDRRAAALPVVAAVGGMVVPAALYAAVNAGSEGSSGWGVPMATDIAFALGVVALLGPRVHPSLKVFLLTLAIVDDIGAILVIAVFYSGGVDWGALAAAAGIVVAIGALRSLGVWWHPVYVGLGLALWLAIFRSGLHATLAGVVMGLLTPAFALESREGIAQRVARFFEAPSGHGARHASRLVRDVVPLTESLQHLLHPWTSYLVVPVFALANAGVALDGDAVAGAATSAVTLGIVLGLVAGKLAGITAASWLAVRLGIATLPRGVTWPQLAGVAAVAGIGFTVALFVAALAFEDARVQAEAKVGILVASLVASAVGAGILAAQARPRPPA
jgi:NhaA family Na+:H+ antiporter